MIRVRQVKISVSIDTEINLKYKVAKKLRIDIAEILDYKINKKSIDARNKKDVYYIYEVDILVGNEDDILKRNKHVDILKTPKEEYVIPKIGDKKLNGKIIVVGSGPAGLFASYLLAKNGYKPIIIERGEKIENRVKTVQKFWDEGILNNNSNVQFGEGGAGTFSDGKINTLVHDKFFRNKKVLETFVEFGAPEEILYLQKPHIGTDILRNIIINMRKKIEELGGKFLYNSCLTNIFVEDGKVYEIEINCKEVWSCEHLILAIGHSARDTFQMLYQNEIEMQAKPFALGVRIEHLQKDINESQYGEFASTLPPASYKLTYTSKNNRGVYSFCMCPGGYVVNASSEKKSIAINGMSNYRRDSKNANSALVVTVSPNDFGTHPLDGIKFQRKLEEKTYKIGNGKIPVQLYKDYKENKISEKFGKFVTEMKGDYEFANLNNLFPDFINESLKEAMLAFGKKINGFDSGDAILSGVESRTSSPVRILRNDNFESNIKGIYPCGEGAGYAGGIMTAAMDGMKVAEEIIKNYFNEF